MFYSLLALGFSIHSPAAGAEQHTSSGLVGGESLGYDLLCHWLELYCSPFIWLGTFISFFVLCSAMPLNNFLGSLDAGISLFGFFSCLLLQAEVLSSTLRVQDWGQ